MTKLSIVLALVLTSTASAMAQNATPATGAPNAPAAARPAAPAATTPAPQVGGPALNVVGIPRGSAATAADARRLSELRIANRKTTCEGKSSLHRFIPPHNAGDPNPKGGFFASASIGACKTMGLGEAMSQGLVTVNPNARRPN
jgi:hypothetical protein